MSENREKIQGGKGNFAHSFIVNDEEVKNYLENCEVPVEIQKIELDPSLMEDIVYPRHNRIRYVIAVDGEYSTIPVRKEFPSSLITFFQFGSVFIKIEDLENIQKIAFISPEDMGKLKTIERLKIVLPTKNVALKKEHSFIYTVRKTIYDFFARKDQDGDCLLPTLEWFLFSLYDLSENLNSYTLSQCPSCGRSAIILKREELNASYIWKCPHCSKDIFITDVFRLSEAVDEDLGAGSILGYVANLIQSFLLIHLIKNILSIGEGCINEFLFIKNGPLSFIGNTANMHKPMRKLLNFLRKKYNINLVGIEKTGAFVDHAKEIQNKLEVGKVLFLNNRHIYTYILPGDPEHDEYAITSYYSGKIIYKTMEGRLYVLTLPIESSDLLARPEKKDFQNIDEILMNIEKLKCDIYESSLLPLAVAGKLISLANHPSSKILEKFVHKTMGV